MNKRPRLVFIFALLLLSFFLLSAPYAMADAITKAALDAPVQGVPFDLTGLEGRFLSQDYKGNAVVLVMGRTTCYNCANCIRRLNVALDDLRSAGVEVIVNLLDCPDVQSTEAIMDDYPNMYFTKANEGLLWSNINAVGLSGTVYLPVVFIYNSDGLISYYSTGEITDINVLLDAAYAEATEKPLPSPRPAVEHVSPVDIDNLSFEGPDFTISASNYNANAMMMLYAKNDEGAKEFLSELVKYDAIIKSLDIKIAVITDGSSGLSSFTSEYPSYDFLYYTPNNLSAKRLILTDAGYTGSTSTLPCVILFDDKMRVVGYNAGDAVDASGALADVILDMKPDVVMPKALMSIEDEAFLDSALRYVDLRGTSVRSISSRAFGECKNLRLIVIGPNVESISDDAFEGCEDFAIICRGGSYASRYATRMEFSKLFY